jgi:hypothetical protein
VVDLIQIREFTPALGVSDSTLPAGALEAAAEPSPAPDAVTGGRL